MMHFGRRRVRLSPSIAPVLVVPRTAGSRAARDTP